MLCLIHEYGLDVSALDMKESPPVFYTRWSMHSDSARRLAAAKFLLQAKVNKYDYLKPRLIAYIRKMFHLPISQGIINMKEPHDAELLRACTDGNITTLQRIFNDLGLQAVILAVTYRAPHLAVENEQYEVLDFLLENGVPVNSRAKDYRTILHTAGYYVNSTAIKKLVANGADLTATDVIGWSILFYLIKGARVYYHKEEEAYDILKWLVQQGADPKHIDKDNTTLVHLAAAWNTPLLIKCLVLEFGLDINAVDYKGTPLHSIILRKYLSTSESCWRETIQCLLDLGARIDIVDNKERTPLDLAKEKNLTDLENLLMEHQQKLTQVEHSKREICSTVAIENLNEQIQNEENNTPSCTNAQADIHTYIQT